MGLFSRKKCPIHGTEYSVGKNYMCQLYYYCKKCSAKAKETKDLEKRVAELERKLNAT